MSEIIPQVGDVYQSCYLKITILFIGKECVIVDELADERRMSIKHLNEMYKLVERDGKPYKPARVFEDGAWYPLILEGVIDKINYKMVGQFNKGVFHADDCYWQPYELKWIGPKLEIEWPDLEGEQDGFLPRGGDCGL